MDSRADTNLFSAVDQKVRPAAAEMMAEAEVNKTPSVFVTRFSTITELNEWLIGVFEHLTLIQRERNRPNNDSAARRYAGTQQYLRWRLVELLVPTQPDTLLIYK